MDLDIIATVRNILIAALRVSKPRFEIFLWEVLDGFAYLID
jgi:hypothetical protein